MIWYDTTWSCFSADYCHAYVMNSGVWFISTSTILTMVKKKGFIVFWDYTLCIEHEYSLDMIDNWGGEMIM